ncbi:ABC transporter ATP-binding protein [Pseudoroseicyclus tamaricis]|uniref:ABC transporter ATP-binding protein n=1 Tax=Pseudoroseicyclus tamaricis TaxID=2705421 RepID=A0A6B2JQD5_9RHOB|nr:ABC transporter ATP-binding protein [Pseudoroseicyclus tamaricis]NDV00240.1 ABC transporter ATP-binding protein [Pseudoroseicyclus tamaricis]
MTLLSVRDLSVSFTTYGRTTQVLHDVSLDVPACSQIALVGESGSGKSVTMKAIMGLLSTPPARINSGQIFYDGEDLLTMPPARRMALRGTAMSMVFQDPMSSLNPVFTIGDQLGTILKYADRRLGRQRGRAGRRARVAEVLAQVRMREPERVAGSYPMQLSGGMRQRVLIAMALLSEPTLLIADEPGTALDVTTQAQILKLLKDLVEAKDLALLMITHNLGVVRETSSYVYVMHKGRVVEEAPTERLFAAPAEQYTRDLIAAVPRLTGPALTAATGEAARQGGGAP